MDGGAEGSIVSQRMERRPRSRGRDATRRDRARDRPTSSTGGSNRPNDGSDETARRTFFAAFFETPPSPASSFAAGGTAGGASSDIVGDERFARGDGREERAARCARATDRSRRRTVFRVTRERVGQARSTEADDERRETFCTHRARFTPTAASMILPTPPRCAMINTPLSRTPTPPPRSRLTPGPRRPRRRPRRPFLSRRSPPPPAARKKLSPPRAPPASTSARTPLSTPPRRP